MPHVCPWPKGHYKLRLELKYSAPAKSFFHGSREWYVRGDDCPTASGVVGESAADRGFSFGGLLLFWWGSEATGSFSGPQRGCLRVNSLF